MNLPDVLRRFAEKKASVDDAMRALVSYDRWFAPMLWASEIFKTNLFDKACLWGNESAMPPATLWLFTDEEAGLRATERGMRPGPFVGPLRGSTIFAHLPNVETLEVNAGSPREQGWYMGGKAMPLGRAWGKAIALEQALDSDDGNFGVALGTYESFGVLVAPSGGIVTAVGAANMKNPGLVFTASDCIDAGRKKLGPAAANLQQGVIAGPTLFRDLAALGVDGYILNIGGVGPTRVFTREACEAVTGVVAAELEARRLRKIADDLA